MRNHSYIIHILTNWFTKLTTFFKESKFIHFNSFNWIHLSIISITLLGNIRQVWLLFVKFQLKSSVDNPWIFLHIKIIWFEDIILTHGKLISLKDVLFYSIISLKNWSVYLRLIINCICYYHSIRGTFLRKQFYEVHGFTIDR
jgi:hypothetical protein